MSRFGYCEDDYEHRRQAERDARYGRPDRDYYDRYTDDPCKEVYTETFDKERGRIELRSELEAEEEREEEAAQARAARRRAEEEAEYQRLQLERDAEENFEYYADVEPEIFDVEPES